MSAATSVGRAEEENWSEEVEKSLKAKVATLGGLAAPPTAYRRRRKRSSLTPSLAETSLTLSLAGSRGEILRGVKSKGAYLSIVLLGLYDLAIGLYSAYPPYWRQAYGVLWLTFLGLVALALLNKHKISSGQLRVLLVMVVATLAWALPAAIQDEVHYIYLASDLVLTGFFSLVFGAHVAFPDLFRDHRRMKQLLMLLVAGLASALVAEWMQLFPTEGLRSFPAPHLLIYPILLVAIWNGRGWGRWLPLALLVVALVMTTISGKRSGVVAAFFVVLVGGFVLLPWRGRLILLLAAIPAMLSAVYLQQELRTFIKKEAVSVVAAGRFNDLADGGEDGSVEGRLGEALDVIAIVQHRSTPLEVLFGHGHGAVYAPTDSNVMSVFTEVQRVHHIHVGLFMFLFRYGLAGMLLYLGTITLVAYDTLKVTVARHVHAYRPNFLIFLLGMWVIAIYSIADHPLHDPLHAFFTVGYFCLRRRSQTRSSVAQPAPPGDGAPARIGRTLLADWLPMPSLRPRLRAAKARSLTHGPG